MPTKPSRARRWLRSGKAKAVYNDLGVFTIQLVVQPSDAKTQPISVGIDPGKKYTGIGVQSAKTTLWMAHLQLPFETVKGRMEQRRMMRRNRRGRRINRKLPFRQYQSCPIYCNSSSANLPSSASFDGSVPRWNQT